MALQVKDLVVLEEEEEESLRFLRQREWEPRKGLLVRREHVELLAMAIALVAAMDDALVPSHSVVVCDSVTLLLLLLPDRLSLFYVALFVSEIL